MKYKTTYYDITFKSNIIDLNNWPIKTPALRLSEKAKTDDVVSLATILVDKLEDTNSVEKLVSYGFVSQPLID